MSFNGVAVVIPTRNRAELAKRAIESVLSQQVANVHVLISDNSTSTQERDELSRFCEQLGHERLQYVVPPQPMPMAAHWQWALDQALGKPVNHFTFLTDRMVYRSGALEQFTNIATQYPDSIISTMHDAIIDDQTPVRIQQNDWSGNLYAIPSSRLVYLVSQSYMHESLPRMLNCIVPRRVLGQFQSRFGDVFSSVAPDFNFCFRSLVVEDQILFYDAALLIHYALDRSNGASTTRGELTPDHADFLANIPRSVVYDMAPIPELLTVQNAIVHEYYVVKKETNSPKFDDVDQVKYIQFLAYEIEQIVDPRRRAEMKRILASYGWSAPQAEPMRHKLLSPRRVANKLVREVKGRSVMVSNLIKRKGGAEDDSNSKEPSGENLFATTEEALQFAIRFPPPRSEEMKPAVKSMLEAEEVPISCNVVR